MSSKYLLTLGFASAVVLGACTPQNTVTPEVTPNQQNEVSEQTSIESQDSLPVDDMMAEEVAITVDSFEFGYSQDQIIANAGDTITVNLTNSGEMPHDFVIDELDVQSEVINNGEETSVTFTIPADLESGTEYAFYCSIGQHRENGMEGMLVIQ